MNLSQLRTALGLRTGVALNQDAADQFLNEALQTINAEFSWPWLQAQETITTTSGDNSYTPAAAWGATLELRRDTDNIALRRMTITELENLFDPDTTGLPSAFAIFGDTIYLRPKPDSTYSLTHRYIKRETDLAAGSDSPLMPAQFHSAIVEYAAYLVFLRASKDSDAEAALKSFNIISRRMADDRRRLAGPLRVRVRPGFPA